jgi:hypothetical protein
MRSENAGHLVFVKMIKVVVCDATDTGYLTIGIHPGEVNGFSLDIEQSVKMVGLPELNSIVSGVFVYGRQFEWWLIVLNID